MVEEIRRQFNSTPGLLEGKGQAGTASSAWILPPRDPARMIVRAAQLVTPILEV